MKRNRTGSAYVYILVTGLLLFLLIGTALTITAQSRRTTAAYANYTGLYDMAAAGNERALFLLREQLYQQYAALDEEIRRQILNGTLTEHIVYKNGAFHLAYPADGYYEKLYQSAARDALSAYLMETTGRSLSPWWWEDTLAVSFPGVTEGYRLVTELDTISNGYMVTTTAYKTVNGVTGYPATVEASIIWRTVPHEELLIPAFTWRDAPAYFADCLFENAPLDTLCDGTRLDALAAHHEPALIVTDAPMLDISALYDGETPGCVFVLYTGGDAFTLYASDPALNVLNGMICCFGELTLDKINLTGTVLSDGSITVTAPSVLTPREDLLFEIPLPFDVQKDVFDFLKLTHFSESTGEVTDIEALLGRVAFDLSDGNGCDIAVNNFDAASLAMVKSKKIAN